MTNAVLIGGQKGGTGKSTTAINLAIMCKMMGHDTVLIDTDEKQFSSSKFIQHRQELKIKPIPECVQLTGKISHEIENLSKRYQRLIIDAGGRDSIELRYAMTAKCVRILISPFKPSEFDLATLENIDDLVMLAEGINPNLNAYIVFTHCKPHVREKALDDAKKFSISFDHMKICDVALYDRVAYQYHVSSALSIIEYETENLENQPAYRIKPPKASLEMCELYEFIFNEKFKHHFIDKFTKKNTEKTEAIT